MLYATLVTLLLRKLQTPGNSDITASLCCITGAVFDNAVLLSSACLFVESFFVAGKCAWLGAREILACLQACAEGSEATWQHRTCESTFLTSMFEVPVPYLISP